MQWVLISPILVLEPGAKAQEPSEPFQRQRDQSDQPGGGHRPFHSYLNNTLVEPCTLRAGRHLRVSRRPGCDPGQDTPIPNIIYLADIYQVSACARPSRRFSSCPHKSVEADHGNRCGDRREHGVPREGTW